MRRSDFSYDLPDELIAQHPTGERGDSRMLCLDGDTGLLVDRNFSDLPSLLHPGDLLVFNNTQVMHARMYGHKVTGGKVEVLLERILEPRRAMVHIRASKSPKPGSEIVVGGHKIQVIGRADALFELVSPEIDFIDLMQQEGHMPLPPYINREDETFDQERYQTIYADKLGAVAAPTAGLHFDESMLETLKNLGIESAWVTLHVGAGTFQPVRADRLEDHVMHSEYVEVGEEVCAKVSATKERGGRVVAVGTTSVRSLESAAAVTGKLKPFQGDTCLFITPGYSFRCVDALVTNFHLSESTLLMLVSAFAGYEEVKAAYQHAITQRYRFFSYGDAMFLGKKKRGMRYAAQK